MFKWHARWVRLVIAVSSIVVLAVGSGAGLRWGSMAEFFGG